MWCSTLLVVDEPRRVLFYPDRLVVEAPPRRRRDPWEQTVLLAPPEKTNPRDPRPVWGRVSKYSASRGLTIVGVAAGVALAVGTGAFPAVNAVTNDPHGLQPLLAATAAGGLTGGATLAFTFPATHDLGTELTPSSKTGLGATKAQRDAEP